MRKVEYDYPPLTQTYVRDGVTVRVFGELDVKTLAKSLLTIYNKKNHE